MASTSAADIEVTWQEGDRCLATSSRDGTLREATIQRLLSTPHNGTATALVKYNGYHNRNDEMEEDEEENEEAVPVAQLQRPGSNQFTQEKPLFHSSSCPPGASVPLVLSSQGEKVPYTINRYLRDYQREGIKFIYDNYIRSRGCIVGDDMGLGKTVQVIGFLAAVLHKTGTWEDIENNRPQFLLTQIPSKQNRPNKVFLIVAPLSVLYNWKEELDTWGHFQCVVVHGLKKEEELARMRNGRSEIALTTYETLRLCLDQFNSIDWSAVIVDEAHKIKNPNSQITIAMKGLKCKIRVGLTGTILQNNLEELWCVMDWAIPGCLGSLGHFKTKFSDPIEWGQKHSATKRSLATGRKAVESLARKISHWFIRRTKTLIKEQLPTKNDRVVYCSLTDFQQTVYQTVLDTEDVTLLLRSSEKCECRSGRTRRRCCYKTNSEGVEVKNLYFSYLSILRKVANHVALLQSTAGTSNKQKKYVNAICEKVFQKFPEFVQRCKEEAFEAMSDPMYSGKMKVLHKLLKYYKQRKDKVLLFSLSTKLLNVLESYCMAEGLDYSRLDGTTKSRERVKIVKEFNSCPHINLCLVSTMAGGLGLNFVGANVVVLFDPTWNPANDLQAIDRAYRIGQCRDVTVLRLISLGTVEEIIYLRQLYKQQLQSSVVGKESARRYFEAVHGAEDQKGELFGIKNLFRLQVQGTCLTHNILEREEQMGAGLMTTSTYRGKEEEEEEEEERKNASGNGKALPVHTPQLNIGPSKATGVKAHIPKGMLDFSSEDEEAGERGARRKASNPTRADDSWAGNTSTSPGRVSLLQIGLSALLQKPQGKRGSVDGSQSEGESQGESGSKEARDEPGAPGKEDNTSSRVSERPCMVGSREIQAQRSRSKKCGVSSSSEGEEGGSVGGERKDKLSVSEESDDLGSIKPGMKDRMNRKKVMESKSDSSSGSDQQGLNTSKTTIPRMPQYISDESEDLGIDALNHNRRWTAGEKGDGDDTSGCKRKRQTIRSRNEARSKHTEDIEIFTSSDEEHTPVKKERSTGGHFTSPLTNRTKSRGQTEKQGQRRLADRCELNGKADRSSEGQRVLPRAVSFTGLKTQTSPASKGTFSGTIDNVLGGVREVVYTHSNQRVVGGSTAEERISRAAVRDVFERKMFSQLPANHLLSTQESLLESTPDPVARPTVDHPVTFTSKTTHHTRQSAFIIGQTPKAIRRQQLEEMAAKLGWSSVQQFAKEILRSSSAQRLAWLRQHYTSLGHVELADTVRNHFPEPESAQPRPEKAPHPLTSPSSTTASSPAATRKHRTNRTSREAGPETTQRTERTPPHRVINPQKEPGTSRRNVLEPQDEAPITEEVEEQGEMVRHARGEQRKKIDCISRSAAASVGGAGVGLGSGQASSSGLGPGEVAAGPDHRDKGAPSSVGLNHDWLSTPSKPTAQGKQREQKSSPVTSKAVRGGDEVNPSPPSFLYPNSRSSLNELLGDTSILDDLFRTKPRGEQGKGSPRAPASCGHASALTSSPAANASRSRPDTAAHTHSLSSLHSNTPSTKPLARSKGSSKDFWDILNEGNEESINRLTDLSEVERVCVSTSRTRALWEGETEAGERTTLWKTNDKFLWKK